MTIQDHEALLQVRKATLGCLDGFKDLSVKQGVEGVGRPFNSLEYPFSPKHLRRLKLPNLDGPIGDCEWLVLHVKRYLRKKSPDTLRTLRGNGYLTVAIALATFSGEELWPGWPSAPANQDACWSGIEEPIREISDLVAKHPLAGLGAAAGVFQVALAWLNGWKRRQYNWKSCSWDGTPRKAKRELLQHLNSLASEAVRYWERKDRYEHLMQQLIDTGDETTQKEKKEIVKNLERMEKQYSPRVRGLPEGRLNPLSLAGRVYRRFCARNQRFHCNCSEGIKNSGNLRARRITCMEHHNLGRWDGKEDLRAFLRHAMLGAASRVIMAAALNSGLLKVFVPEIRFEPVAVRDCPYHPPRKSGKRPVGQGHGAADSEETAQEVVGCLRDAAQGGDEPRGDDETAEEDQGCAEATPERPSGASASTAGNYVKEEGKNQFLENCTDCGRAFDQKEHRVGYISLFFFDGVFSPRPFWKCEACPKCNDCDRVKDRDNYFPSSKIKPDGKPDPTANDRCPRCDREHSHKFKTLYVLRTPKEPIDLIAHLRPDKFSFALLGVEAEEGGLEDALATAGFHVKFGPARVEGFLPEPCPQLTPDTSRSQSEDAWNHRRQIVENIVYICCPQWIVTSFDFMLANPLRGPRAEPHPWLLKEFLSTSEEGNCGALEILEKAGLLSKPITAALDEWNGRSGGTNWKLTILKEIPQIKLYMAD